MYLIKTLVSLWYKHRTKTYYLHLSGCSAYMLTRLHLGQQINMAVDLLRLRTSVSRLPKLCFHVSQKQHLAGNICLFSTQTSTKPATFQRIPREELVPKVKSRLKDRPYMVGSTGQGFPEFLGEPTESFPHGVFVNNPHQAALAELTAKCMLLTIRQEL